MALSLRFIPRSTIRWRERRFVVVDYAGMDAIFAREVGKRGLFGPETSRQPQRRSAKKISAETFQNGRFDG
jgi:hypothetical protein